VAEREVWVPQGGPRTLEVVHSDRAAFGPRAAEPPAADGAQQLRLPLGSWALGLRAAPPGEPGSPPGRLRDPPEPARGPGPGRPRVSSRRAPGAGGPFGA